MRLVEKYSASPFVQPLGEVQLGHLAVQLVRRFVEHPMVGIQLIGRIIGAAVRLPVKRFRPTQARVHPANLPAILVKQQLQSGMFMAKRRQGSKAIGIGVIKQFHDPPDLLGLCLRSGGGDEVMRCFDGPRRRPRTRAVFPDHHAQENGEINEQPHCARVESPGRTHCFRSHVLEFPVARPG